jgi:hypothetical protein
MHATAIALQKKTVAEQLEWTQQRAERNGSEPAAETRHHSTSAAGLNLRQQPGKKRSISFKTPQVESTVSGNGGGKGLGKSEERPRQTQKRSIPVDSQLQSQTKPPNKISRKTSEGSDVRLLDYVVYREVRLLLIADEGGNACISLSEAAIHQSMESIIDKQRQQNAISSSAEVISVREYKAFREVRDLLRRGVDGSRDYDNLAGKMPVQKLATHLSLEDLLQSKADIDDERW